MKEDLLDRVLAQIAKDAEAGDLTAIAELIADIPDDKALHFLPEEEWAAIDGEHYHAFIATMPQFPSLRKGESK